MIAAWLEYGYTIREAEDKPADLASLIMHDLDAAELL